MKAHSFVKKLVMKKGCPKEDQNWWTKLLLCHCCADGDTCFFRLSVQQNVPFQFGGTKLSFLKEIFSGRNFCNINILKMPDQKDECQRILMKTHGIPFYFSSPLSSILRCMHSFYSKQVSIFFFF